MAIAVLKVVKLTGSAPGMPHDVDGRPNFLSEDVQDSDPNNYALSVPLQPGDPAFYSYELKIVLELTAAPDNQVSNFQVWGPANRPNNDPYLTDYIGSEAMYTQPVNTASSIATASIHDNHYSPGTALALGGTLVNIGDQTEILVLQSKVENGAGKGDVPTSTFLYSYDEQ